MVAVGSIFVFLALVVSAVSSRVVSREERLSRGQNSRNVRSVHKSALGSPRSLNSMLKQPILSFGSWFGSQRSKRPVDVPEVTSSEELKENLLETIDNLLLNELKKEVADDAEVVVGDDERQNPARSSRLRRFFGNKAVLLKL